MIRVSDARLMVAHADLVPRLREIEPARLEAVVVHGGSAATSLAVHGPEALAPSDRTLPPLGRPIEPWDTQTVIFTSGTTGPLQGACCRPTARAASMMGPEAVAVHHRRRPLLHDHADVPRRRHRPGHTA